MMRAELGILVETDQARGEPPHRPHEEIVEREVDQARGQGRDDQRDHHDIAGEAVHRLPQRLLVGDDFDELGIAHAGADDADGLVAGLQHHLERAGDRLPRRHVAQVDVVLDRGRQVVAGEQPALLAHLDRDRARIDAFQDLPRQRIGNHAERRRVEHESCGVGCGDTVVQAVDPEIRDRRHVEQAGRDHHQGNGQHQQLAGQAEPARLTRPRRRPVRLIHLLGRLEVCRCHEIRPHCLRL